MKVYEKINEIKGTQASAETIEHWMYMNRICPPEVGMNLMLEPNEIFPEDLQSLAEKHCEENAGHCGEECARKFLQREYR